MTNVEARRLSMFINPSTQLRHSIHEFEVELMGISVSQIALNQSSSSLRSLKMDIGNEKV